MDNHNESGDLVENNEVSDYDSLGSDGDHDDELDDLIDSGPATVSSGPSNTVHAPVTKNSSINILNREYGDEQPPPVLPAVSEQLAKTVTKWMRVAPSREVIKGMFKEIVIPDNIEGINPVKINEVLYQSIPFHAKVEDQCLRGINTYLQKGVGILTFLLDRFIEIEGTLCTDNPTKPNIVALQDGKIKIDDTEYDFHQLRSLLHQATHLLATCNSVCLLKHKLGLKKHIGEKYHFLTKSSNPVTNELLGPDVEQKVTDSNRVSEVARKLGKNNFRGRSSRGRGKNYGRFGYHPYQ